jgi:sugar phosphate isomerase/epimerase
MDREHGAKEACDFVHGIDFEKSDRVFDEAFDKYGVKLALEVHPTEIAFDIHTARRALAAVKNRKAFGFNFDPSHLHWQMVDPVRFLQAFPKKIYHVHMKDAAITLDGESGILSSHLNFGAPGRGWDFRSLGRGDVDFEAIIRELNVLGYKGPLSVEWEDAAMDREHGAKEACDFVQWEDAAMDREHGAKEACDFVHGIDFEKSDRVFDEAFDK